MDASTIHVSRFGTEGPKVVLVHGGAQGSRVGGDRQFERQLPLAQNGWRLVLPDRPGHGRSPPPGRGDDYAADGALVAMLIDDGTHVVAHSFGACVALDAVIRKPSAVRSLTLIEPGMLKLALDKPAVRRLVLRMALAMLFSFSPEQRARRAVRLLGNAPTEISSRFGFDEFKKIGKSLPRMKFPSKATLARQLAELQREKIQLLVVSGGWSPAFEETADKVAEAGGGERLVISVGHHFPQLAEDIFNPALIRFMESAATRGSQLDE